MLQRDDARLKLREVREALGGREPVGPFHLENVFSGRCVESCDESRDAIAAFKKPNHVCSIGPTKEVGHTACELMFDRVRATRPANRPMALESARNEYSAARLCAVRGSSRSRRTPCSAHRRPSAQASRLSQKPRYSVGTRET